MDEQGPLLLASLPLPSLGNSRGQWRVLATGCPQLRLAFITGLQRDSPTLGALGRPGPRVLVELGVLCVGRSTYCSTHSGGVPALAGGCRAALGSTSPTLPSRGDLSTARFGSRPVPSSSEAGPGPWFQSRSRHPGEDFPAGSPFTSYPHTVESCFQRRKLPLLSLNQHSTSWPRCPPPHCVCSGWWSVALSAEGHMLQAVTGERLPPGSRSPLLRQLPGTASCEAHLPVKHLPARPCASPWPQGPLLSGAGQTWPPTSR